MRIRVEGGDTVAVDLRDADVEVDGDGPYVVSEVDLGVYQVAKGAERWIVYVASEGERCWVACDGVVHIIDPAETRGAPAAGRELPRLDRPDGQLSAPMPATVTRVLVAPGQRVAEGDVLLVLEAMKMELPMRAPRAGLVRAVLCRDGELVQPGVPLLDIE